MNPTVTIVLPLHNAEHHLSQSVLDILDVVESQSERLMLVLVDDGSTDDTFEMACELSRCYPQSPVLRQPVRSGLGPTLELVQHQLSSRHVIVHDGVSPLDCAQLQAVLMSRNAEPTVESDPRDGHTPSLVESRGSRRFAAVSALNSSMRKAHHGLTGFQWMLLAPPLSPRRHNLSYKTHGRNPSSAPITTSTSITPAIDSMGTSSKSS